MASTSAADDANAEQATVSVNAISMPPPVAALALTSETALLSKTRPEPE